jgi:hypothetical protein
MSLMENSPERLTDGALTAALTRLAAVERASTAALIAHLAEFDARRLYLGAGFSSLFGYCREVLRLSEHESYNRIEAARAGRRFPAVLRMLSEGTVNLTAVRLLAPHLTEANHRELLEAASGSGKRDVEELIARNFPRPDVVTTIRRLPGARMERTDERVIGTDAGDAALARGLPASTAPVSPAPEIGTASEPTIPVGRLVPERTAARADEMTPLAPGRYAVRFTASAQTRESFASPRTSSVTLFRPETWR